MACRCTRRPYWYYRACRAAVAGAGGHLSGPFQELAVNEQRRAILSLVELREDVGLPDPRETVPAMVDIAGRHPRLNLLNLEAAAAARLLGATIWLSEPATAGTLPPYSTPKESSGEPLLSVADPPCRGFHRTTIRTGGASIERAAARNARPTGIYGAASATPRPGRFRYVGEAFRRRPAEG